MNKQEILKMLRHAEQEAVYSFIATYGESDAEFCKKLKAALMPGGKNDTNIETYRAKAESCFDFELGERGWRNFNFYQAARDAASGLENMLSDADYLIEQGEYASAAGIAMSVIEVIPLNYSSVDDSSGCIGATFCMATEYITNILLDEKVPETLKKQIYEWVKKEMDNSIYADYGFDSLDEVYEVACEELGETYEVLADLDKQIEAADDFRKEIIVLRKIQFMESRELDTQPVIEEYLEMDDVRKIKFSQLKESGLYDEALDLAKKGIEIASTKSYWGTISNWEQSMLEIYLKQGNVKNILLQAEKLLFKDHCENNKYYQIIKEHTDPNNWTDALERILSSFENRSFFTNFVANVMVEHQMWNRLFAYCNKGHNTATTIQEYEKYLKPHFEKEILDIYHQYVEQEALITNSSAYECVAKMLKHMRTFKGGNAVVNQLLEKYRNTYKRRKNMMAALNNV